MCCFTGPVAAVAQTNLFARASTENRQFLVYQMELRAADPLAMILPLPVPAGGGEEAVRFIDFSAYPHFFADLRKPFAVSGPATRAGGGGAAALPMPTLAVHQVGSFEASFVPTLDDFHRLDARFRLAKEVWAELPRYADWGFAVFKLRNLAQNTAIEPMALEFARRDPRGLFFPTVHVHDGQVHATAAFDHNLFFQSPYEDGVVAAGRYARLAGSSAEPAREFASPLLAGKVLDEDLPVQVVRFAGELPNRDSELLTPSPDPELEIPDGPLPRERAVARVLRLLRVRQNDAATDPAAAREAVRCLPWCTQYVGLFAPAMNLAPFEAWTGKPYVFDERSEVYAFGALLHQLLRGEPPFGEGLAALAGHYQLPPPPLGSPLDPIVRRAMAKNPDERFPSLAAFAAALLA
jgi:hypothetical protein